MAVIINAWPFIALPDWLTAVCFMLLGGLLVSLYRDWRAL